MKSCLYALFAGLVLTAAPAHALEAPKTFRAEYKLSFLGFNIATSNFVSTFTGDTFVLDGILRSAGIARLFDRTTAKTRVTGRLEGETVKPLEYVLSYVSGNKKQRTEIRFDDGNVAKTENQPPLKHRSSDWVPLGTEDLSAVFDPLSASIIRAASPRQVCDRTVRAYDGEMRVDLQLKYIGMTPFSTRGFKGQAVRCAASFLPVSGYRKGRRALHFMKYKSRIEIAFAPTGTGNIYAPVMARVGTQVGPIYLYATRFGAAE